MLNTASSLLSPHLLASLLKAGNTPPEATARLITLLTTPPLPEGAEPAAPLPQTARLLPDLLFTADKPLPKLQSFQAILKEATPETLKNAPRELLRPLAALVRHQIAALPEPVRTYARAALPPEVAKQTLGDRPAPPSRSQSFHPLPKEAVPPEPPNPLRPPARLQTAALLETARPYAPPKTFREPPEQPPGSRPAPLPVSEKLQTTHPLLKEAAPQVLKTSAPPLTAPAETLKEGLKPKPGQPPVQPIPPDKPASKSHPLLEPPLQGPLRSPAALLPHPLQAYALAALSQETAKKLPADRPGKLPSPHPAGEKSPPDKTEPPPPLPKETVPQALKAALHSPVRPLAALLCQQMAPLPEPVRTYMQAALAPETLQETPEGQLFPHPCPPPAAEKIPPRAEASPPLPKETLPQTPKSSLQPPAPPPTATPARIQTAPIPPESLRAYTQAAITPEALKELPDDRPQPRPSRQEPPVLLSPIPPSGQRKKEGEPDKRGSDGEIRALLLALKERLKRWKAFFLEYPEPLWNETPLEELVAFCDRSILDIQRLLH